MVKITDLGYAGCGEGWYDVQEQGVKNDYCRWVGRCGCRGPCSFWSCALAGRKSQYTEKGVYKEGTSILGITEWGEWKAAEKCPNNGKVNGFKLRVEENQGEDGDDSALNGIWLKCNTGDILKIDGYWGSWGTWKNCPPGDYFTGARIRSEESQGDGDDTAANDLNMRCKTDGWKEGKGQTWGSWGGATQCAGDQWICGLQVKMEPPQGQEKDDTALNQVKFACCDIPEIVKQKSFCFKKNKQFIGFALNKPGGNNNYGETDSAEDCQALCARIGGCRWFNWSKDKNCLLKTKRGGALRYFEGAVTGPVECTDAVEEEEEEEEIYDPYDGDNDADW